MSLINPQQVLVDLPDGDRERATRALAETLVSSGRITDIEVFLTDVAEREASMPTGLPGGIAIPHCRSTAVTEPSLAFGRSTGGIPWGAPDGPSTLIFLIAAPAGGGEEHLMILAKLARKLMHEDFKQSLRDAPTAADVAHIIEEQVVNA